MAFSNGYSVAFSDELSEDKAHYNALMARGDSEGMADLAHRHASSAAVFGFMALSGFCRQLEEDCRRKDPQSPAPIIPVFFNLIDRTAQAAEYLIRNQVCIPEAKTAPRP